MVVMYIVGRYWHVPWYMEHALVHIEPSISQVRYQCAVGYRLVNGQNVVSMSLDDIDADNPVADRRIQCVGQSVALDIGIDLSTSIVLGLQSLQCCVNN